MPIHIGWLVENRVSYFKYVGDITLEEIIEASAIGIELIELCDAPLLHTIQDSHDLVNFPNQINSLFKSVSESLSHPRMGWMVSIGINNDLIRFIARMVSKLTGTRSRLFPNLEEATTFLNYVDATLPALGDIAPPSFEAMLYHIDHSTDDSLDSSDKTA